MPRDPESLARMMARHDTIKALWPGLRTLTTNHPVWNPVAIGHEDVWVGKVGFYNQLVEPHIEALRSLNSQIWYYETGYDAVNWDPPYPYFEIAEPAIDHRLWFWHTWLSGGDGLLLWGTNLWPHFRYPEELDGLPAVPPYDRWPQRAWDDAGWVERGYYGGRCYLIYPGPNGPLASIRLEQIRDDIEDWEYLRLLGRQVSPGVWNGLIGRAQRQGIEAPMVQSAMAAANLESVITDIRAYTNDPAAVEAKRRSLGEAIEALTLALPGGG